MRVIIFICLTWFYTATAIAATQSNFLVIADIHFDPFFACYAKDQQLCPLIKRLQVAPVEQWPAILAADKTTTSQYHKDTGIVLLNQSLAAAKQAASEKQAKFVLVLGDFLGHEFRRYYKKYAQDKSRAGYQAFVRKTLVFLNNELEQTFPGIDVYSLLGNNDSDHADYYVEPRGHFLQQTAPLWASLIKTSANRARMQREFPVGGYYAADVPQQKNMQFIMLNSVMFSTKVRGNHLPEAAQQELDWLQATLQRAKDTHQRVYIAMHIPEGIDLSAGARAHFRLAVLWQTEYVQTFQALLTQYAPSIAAVFTGHLHMDWAEVEEFNDGSEIPFYGVPSISPIFGNAPAFKVYTYSPETGQVEDLMTGQI